MLISAQLQMSAGVCAENKERKEKKRKDAETDPVRSDDPGSASLTFGGMVLILFASRFSAHGVPEPLCCCCCCWGVKLQLISVQFVTFSSSPGPHSPSNSGTPSLPLSFSPSFSLSLPLSFSLSLSLTTNRHERSQACARTNDTRTRAMRDKRQLTLKYLTHD